ncbi:MAG: DUF5777 family beta-barrel protein [Panacibacter sp.]
MLRKKIILIYALSLLALHSIAQNVNLDSLLDAEMDKKNKSEIQFTESTFKAGRLINSHTVETSQKGVLDFKISHRFSTTDNGLYDMLGLDNAISIRIGGDYGLTNRLTIGGGRSSFEKEYDAFLKYRLLWQSTGKTKMPVSLSLLSSVMLQTLKPISDSIKINTGDRFSYAFQVLLARKFNSNFSMQVMPAMVINNPSIRKDNSVPSNLLSIGVGARLKLSKRSGIIAEYYYQLPGYKLPGSYNPLSIGYEIETGGHVFQFNISNSAGITERTAITETNNPFNFDNLHLGFNISRVFSIKKPKDISQLANSNPAQVHDTAQIVIEKEKSPTQYTQATFTTTRLINGHTIETTQRGVLDLKVVHRFGKLNTGFYNVFGLDQASMRIGADYGITNRLTIGGGRSAGGLVNPSLKEYDGFIKYKLLRQSSGEKSMPVTVTVLSSVMYNALRETKEIGVMDPVNGGYYTDSSQTVKINTSDRFHFAYEILLARKFSDAISVQLMPTMVHYNIVPDGSIPNDLFTIGAGIRIRLTPRSNLNLEYYYQVPGRKLPGTFNSFAVGYELETGGHVFQFQLTNSYGTTERTFLHETSGGWGNGDIHFGFNIARVFTIVKPKTTD